MEANATREMEGAREAREREKWYTLRYLLFGEDVVGKVERGERRAVREKGKERDEGNLTKAERGERGEREEHLFHFVFVYKKVLRPEMTPQIEVSERGRGRERGPKRER